MSQIELVLLQQEPYWQTDDLVEFFSRSHPLYIVLHPREWVGDLYRRFTREMRQEAEELREILGYEKPTRKDPYGKVSGTASLRKTQRLGALL